ncbi:DUF6418 domain-containing protein [Pseudotabrizicola algicola]|uniref:DUF6418 domain-containing protein n=1 Tax=Pseudotabrizicola algicola TaxID=2709381 RepID=A0A6B3RKA5_9RHOB|nr:DUF6418 domain-containing protein [Pseudotabrizicola algicola]NEX45851.1 hypothetical protein [Pseudotabrizicola algicola]
MTLRNLVAFSVISLGLIGLNLLGSVLSSSYPSSIWAYVGFFCFAGFCAALAKMRPASFILLSPLLFLRLTEMFAGIPIESGAYIPELGVHGEPTGAFVRLSALYIFIFWITSSVIESNWRRVSDAYRQVPEIIGQIKGVRIFYVVIIAMLSYAFLLGVREGFPMFTGSDRFAFRRVLDDRIFVTFINNRQILAFILGVLLLDSARRKFTFYLILSLYVISILFAEKFTSLAMMTLLILIPTALLYVARHGEVSLKKTFFVLGFISVLTMPLVLIVYGFQENSAMAFERLFSRMAAQGEFWWSADLRYGEFFHLDTSPLMADMRTWLNPSLQNHRTIGAEFGLYYVMQHHAVAENVYYAEHRGIGYVFTLFAYIMMTTGGLGLILITPLLHLIYALVMIWAVRAIIDLSILRIVLSMKLFVFILSGGFVVGYLWNFFGIKTIALALSIIGLKVLHDMRRRSKERRPSANRLVISRALPEGSHLKTPSNQAI